MKLKLCIKCNKEFPQHIKINGITKNLQNRKYCLDCSPYLNHNTSQLHNVTQSNTDSKVCSECKCEKPLDNFYHTLNKNGSKKYQPFCKKCNTLLTLNRQRYNKIKSVNYKGSKCQICGYDKCLNALQFHHLDPSKKDFTIGHNHLLSFDTVKYELDKCVLVCSNCHFEIHAGLHEEKITSLTNA